MKTVLLDVPALGLIVASRSALAFGVGLLVAGRFSDDRRRAIALTSIAIGTLMTVQAIRTVIAGFDRTMPSSPPSVGRDKRLTRSTRFPRKGDDDNF